MSNQIIFGYLDEDSDDDSFENKEFEIPDFVKRMDKKAYEEATNAVSILRLRFCEYLTHASWLMHEYGITDSEIPLFEGEQSNISHILELVVTNLTHLGIQHPLQIVVDEFNQVIYPMFTNKLEWIIPVDEGGHAELLNQLAYYFTLGKSDIHTKAYNLVKDSRSFEVGVAAYMVYARNLTYSLSIANQLVQNGPYRLDTPNRLKLARDYIYMYSVYFQQFKGKKKLTLETYYLNKSEDFETPPLHIQVTNLAKNVINGLKDNWRYILSLESLEDNKKRKEAREESPMLEDEN